jgi:hypothetical protein
MPMPTVNDLAQVGHRVAATHGWAAAKAFKAYVWSEQDQAAIAACASKILKLFPQASRNEDLLSATLAFQLQRRLQAPIYLVAGALSVNGVTVCGDQLPSSDGNPFDADALPWERHLWIMVGPHVVDATIFRLANRPDCPSALARHVHSVFGPDKGLYVDHWRRTRRVGLEYDPRYILSNGDMDNLLSAAYILISGGAL